MKSLSPLLGGETLALGKAKSEQQIRSLFNETDGY